MMFKLLQNQNGQAMAFATVVAAAAIGGAMMMFGKDPNSRIIKINNARYTAEMIKENLMATLDNDAAWMKTIESNPNLECLKNPGDVCGADKFGVIQLFDADGTPITTATDSSGFDFSGRPCQTFSKTNPDLNCVFRYQVSWRCNGACGTTTFAGTAPVALSPKIRLIGRFEFASKDKDLLYQLQNKNKAFTFDFIRAAKAKTLSQFCQSVEGIFDQRNGACSSKLVPPDTFDCTKTFGANYWFVGFDNSGQPVCKLDKKIGYPCWSGSAVVGYTSDGRLKCGPF